MTTRNQRRNRQLAIARARVRALEAQVAALRERLAEHEGEAFIIHLAPSDRVAWQDAFNHQASNLLAAMPTAVSAACAAAPPGVAALLESAGHDARVDGGQL